MGLDGKGLTALQKSMGLILRVGRSPSSHPFSLGDSHVSLLVSGLISPPGMKCEFSTPRSSALNHQKVHQSWGSGRNKDLDIR